MLRNMLNKAARITGKYGRMVADVIDGGTTQPSLAEGMRIAHAAGALEVAVPRVTLDTESPEFKEKVRAYAVSHDMDIGDY